MHPMRLRVVLVLVLTYLGSLSLTAQERRLSASEMFGVYNSLFASVVVSELTVAQLSPSWAKEGLVSRGKDSWQLRDATGTFIMNFFPTQGSVFLTFIPSAPAKFGDASLAALLNKAIYVNITDADTLELTMTSEELSSDGSSGRKTERLSFSLLGGAWVRTSASVQWGR